MELKAIWINEDLHEYLKVRATKEKQTLTELANSIVRREKHENPL